jgi:hypothetical protein
MRVENQTKNRVCEDFSLTPETLTKNAVQEFPLKGYRLRNRRFSEIFQLFL